MPVLRGFRAELPGGGEGERTGASPPVASGGPCAFGAVLRRALRGHPRALACATLQGYGPARGCLGASGYPASPWRIKVGAAVESSSHSRSGVPAGGWGPLVAGRPVPRRSPVGTPERERGPLPRRTPRTSTATAVLEPRSLQECACAITPRCFTHRDPRRVPKNSTCARRVRVAP